MPLAFLVSTAPEIVQARAAGAEKLNSGLRPAHLWPGAAALATRSGGQACLPFAGMPAGRRVALKSAPMSLGERPQKGR